MALRKVRNSKHFFEGENVLAVKGFERFNRLHGVGVKAGIVEGRSPDYPDGTDIVMVAKVQHDGSESQNIPSRPWLRIGFERNKDIMETQMREAAEHILSGTTTAGAQMALVGQQLVSMHRQSLAQLQAPALKPSTVARKAQDRATGRKRKPPAQYHFPVEKPLVETAHLLQSHVFVVEGK